jgi:hypothetical protein
MNANGICCKKSLSGTQFSILISFPSHLVITYLAPYFECFSQTNAGREAELSLIPMLGKLLLAPHHMGESIGLDSEVVAMLMVAAPTNGVGCIVVVGGEKVCFSVGLSLHETTSEPGRILPSGFGRLLLLCFFEAVNCLETSPPKLLA